MNRLAVLCCLLAPLSFAHADVSVTDTGAALRGHPRANASGATVRQAKPGDKRNGIPLDKFTPLATGSQALIDASGLKYFINTTSRSAPRFGVRRDVRGQLHACRGGNDPETAAQVASTLNDAFDGYNTLCLSLDNTVATCETGNANFAHLQQERSGDLRMHGHGIRRQPAGRFSEPDLRQHHHVAQGFTFPTMIRSRAG